MNTDITASAKPEYPVIDRNPPFTKTVANFNTLDYLRLITISGVSVTVGYLSGNPPPPPPNFSFSPFFLNLLGLYINYSISKISIDLQELSRESEVHRWWPGVWSALWVDSCMLIRTLLEDSWVSSLTTVRLLVTRNMLSRVCFIYCLFTFDRQRSHTFEWFMFLFQRISIIRWFLNMHFVIHWHNLVMLSWILCCWFFPNIWCACLFMLWGLIAMRNKSMFVQSKL